MARLNDNAQWIVLLGLIICVGMIALAVIINESVLVGQTTAESVLDFSKSDIQGLRGEILRAVEADPENAFEKITDNAPEIDRLYLLKKHAIVNITPENNIGRGLLNISIHYNNGVTIYNETMVFVNQT